VGLVLFSSIAPMVVKAPRLLSLHDAVGWDHGLSTL
jgi:hypothetical protein